LGGEEGQQVNWRLPHVCFPSGSSKSNPPQNTLTSLQRTLDIHLYVQAPVYDLLSSGFPGERQAIGLGESGPPTAVGSDEETMPTTTPCEELTAGLGSGFHEPWFHWQKALLIIRPETVRWHHMFGWGFGRLWVWWALTGANRRTTSISCSWLGYGQSPGQAGGSA
jgi:hypothetical protein